MSEVLDAPRGIWIWGGLLVVAVTALYLCGSVGFPLAEPDEARYGEVAREMLVQRDWVTPHLNFEPYLHKPPLLFWLSAASFGWLGVSEFAGRLPVVLTGLGTLAMTALLAARMYGGGVAVVAVTVTALAPLFALLAQLLTPNMPLACFLTLALGAVWFGAGSQGRTWWRVAYVSSALAVLAKGPVAVVLAGAAAGLFLLSGGGRRALWQAVDAVGVALAAAVALPWFVLVSWRNPEFLHFFVVEQHVARYLWSHEHPLSWWAFLAVLPVGMLPWTLLPLLDWSATRGCLNPRAWAPATRFLVLWVVVMMGFFALSTSKLATYALPAVPPAAILLARYLCLTLGAGRNLFLSRGALSLLIGGAIMGLCAAVLPLFVSHWRMPLVVPYLYAGGLALVAGGWLVGRALAAGRPWAALAAFAAGWFSLVAVAVAGRGLANESRSLALAARADGAPGGRLAVYRADLYGMIFYTGQRVIVVGGRKDTAPYGGRPEASAAWLWPGDDDLRRAWQEPERMLLVIGPRDLARLDPPLDPPPILVAADARKVLVANRRTDPARPAALPPASSGPNPDS